MMHNKTLHSLLIVSFLVVFAASMSFANAINVESKSNLPRCALQSVNVTVDVTATGGASAVEVVLVVDQAVGANCGFLESLSVSWNLATGILDDRFVDVTSHADGVAPDTIRFAAMQVATGGPLPMGAGQALATISFNTSDCCSGSATINGADWSYANPTGGITSQVVSAGDNSTQAATVAEATVGIENQDPTLDPIANASLPWGATYSGSAVGDDPDLPNGCESISYTKVGTEPTDLTVTPSGNIMWTIPNHAACDNDVTVRVTDGCGAFAEQTFTISVTNQPPTIACPGDITVCKHTDYRGQAIGDDPDDPDGPDPLLYSLLEGPTGMQLDQQGNLSWDDAVPGVHTVTVSVTDGGNLCDSTDRNADTCSFDITVKTIDVVIEKVHDQIQGQFTSVSIDFASADADTWDIGGFDFLVEYDNSAMSFSGATEGELYGDCAWEYFTYRYGPNGNCGSACPTGKVRVVGIAESQGGNIANHPTCNGLADNDPLIADFADLSFLISNDRTLNCQFAPIRFCWIDCADNSLSDVQGDSLFISNRVYDYAGEIAQVVQWTDITGLDNTFPSLTGAISDCDVFTSKGTPVRCVDFYNGGIDIVCADSIDAPGDINQNNIAYEIADAVMYSNYFVEGLTAFGDSLNGAVAASDVNKDGLTLTVADLVYLIRVVVGDAQPYPKVATTSYSYENGRMDVSGDMGAAFVVLAGDATVSLHESVVGMKIDSRFDGTNTRVLIVSEFDENTTILNTFSGSFLNTDADLVSIEFSSADGQVVAAKEVPRSFALMQNYPNPFNPTTKISVRLTEATDWHLSIYNISGQIVESFAGETSGPETIIVDWNANGFASGVYFYKVVAGNHSQTKKAVLLK